MDVFGIADIDRCTNET